MIDIQYNSGNKWWKLFGTTNDFITDDKMNRLKELGFLTYVDGHSGRNAILIHKEYDIRVSDEKSSEWVSERTQEIVEMFM